jgi:hypothetical protein
MHGILNIKFTIMDVNEQPRGHYKERSINAF